MTLRTLGPAHVGGTVEVPASKSYTHRALVTSYLSGRDCTIVRPLVSDDTVATRHGIAALGRAVRTGGDRWAVGPLTPSRRVRGPIRIDCGRSGTTLRFLVAVAALLDREVVFDGEAELAVRPIDPLLEFLQTAGARVQRARGGRSLPLTIRGPIGPVHTDLDASASSQFLSALLLALPVLEGDSVVTLRGPLVSGAYIDSTLAAMARSGVRARFDGRVAWIPGGQRYRGGRLTLPGDASSAAYLWAAGALSGGEVRVRGVPRDRPQADLAILDILEAMGAGVTRHSDGAAAAGSALRGTDTDLTDTPDLYPLVGVLAAHASGESRLLGAPHLSKKESNRHRATVELARAAGGTVRPSQGGLVIRGSRRHRAVTLRGCRDHRIVMSAAVAALSGDTESSIEDADAVSKSYPGFWAALRSIGAPARANRP